MHTAATTAPAAAPVVGGLGSALLFGLLTAGLIIDVAILARLRRQPPHEPGIAGRLASRPWMWPECGALLMLELVLIGFSLLLSALLAEAADVPRKSLLLYSTLGQTVAMHAIAVAFILSAMRARQLSWRGAFGLHRTDALRHVRLGMALYIGIIPIGAFYTLLYAGLLQRLGFSLESQPVLRLLTDPDVPLWPQVCLGVMAVVSAPIVEELFFRGILLPVAARRFGPMPAVYLVSLFFAVVHGHPASMATLFILAVALSLAYLYSGSIAVPIVLHALFNGVSLAAYLVLVERGNLLFAL